MKRVTSLTPTKLPAAPDPDDAGFGALKTAAGRLGPLTLIPTGVKPTA